MGAVEWVMIGTTLFIQITALVGTYINVRVKLKELDVKIQNTQSALNLHERQNERTFDKLDKKLDSMQKGIFSEINTIKEILMQQNRSYGHKSE